MHPTWKENRPALVGEKSVTWTSCIRANKSSLVVLHSKVQIPERFSFREGTREKERKKERSGALTVPIFQHIFNVTTLSFYSLPIFIYSTSEGLWHMGQNMQNVTTNRQTMEFNFAYSILRDNDACIMEA